MITLIRTILVFAVVGAAVIGFTPFGLAAFVLSLLGLKKPMALVTYRLAQGWARFLIFLSGCRLTVEGRENIPRKGGLCFVSNHTGIFDIILALAFTGRPFGFIAKKELLLLPLLNIWISLLGGLFIDRKEPKKALLTIQKGIRRIKAGGAMLIFPEGHRSRGQGLLPFRPGSFKLATQSGAPIVPVAITGGYEIFEKERRVRTVPVRIIFSPPLETASLPPEDRKQALANQVYAVIAGALGISGSGSTQLPE
jgi:1-acyl-sn-glycerol-3-phosphate acyltransferase